MSILEVGSIQASACWKTIFQYFKSSKQAFTWEAISRSFLISSKFWNYWSLWCLIFIHVILIEITTECNMGITWCSLRHERVNEAGGSEASQDFFSILGRILCRVSDEVIVIRGFGLRSLQEMFAILACIFCKASDEFIVIRRNPPRNFFDFRVYFMQIFWITLFLQIMQCVSTSPGCSRPKRPKPWVDHCQWKRRNWI